MHSMKVEVINEDTPDYPDVWTIAHNADWSGSIIVMAPVYYQNPVTQFHGPSLSIPEQVFHAIGRAYANLSAPGKVVGEAEASTGSEPMARLASALEAVAADVKVMREVYENEYAGEAIVKLPPPGHVLTILPDGTCMLSKVTKADLERG